MREDTTIDTAGVPEPAPGPAARDGLDVANALGDATRLLHGLWEAERDDDRRLAFGIAATITAHAAIDALLQDWARRERPDLETWKSGTTLMRAARFTAALDRAMPPHVRELSQVRRAFGRDPTRADLERADAWLRGDGADRALATLRELEGALRPRR